MAVAVAGPERDPHRARIRELIIRDLPSAHHNQRPRGSVIDTVILHSMHHPDDPEPLSAAACKRLLDRHGVSAHYIIDRGPDVWRLADETRRAWHAGKSRMPEDGRQNVNDFSIGVELTAFRESGYTDGQYDLLTALIREIIRRHPVIHFYGHRHVAPARKTDPWAFDWPRFRRAVGDAGGAPRRFRFPPEALTQETHQQRRI